MAAAAAAAALVACSAPAGAPQQPEPTTADRQAHAGEPHTPRRADDHDERDDEQHGRDAAPASAAPPASTDPGSSSPPVLAAGFDGSTLPDVVDDPAPPTGAVLAAAGEMAPIYFDGCHLSWDDIAPKLCEYGDPDGTVTVAVTGDSHAAHWFAGLTAASETHRWRLVTVTKAGCPAADVPVYSARPEHLGHGVEYTECPLWRAEAQKLLRELRPDVIVYPMLTRRPIVDVRSSAAPPVWAAGLETAVAAVATTGHAPAVVILGDTPKTVGRVIPGCVAENPDDLRVCGNPRTAAVDPVTGAMLAETAGRLDALYVDPAGWFCTDAFCPAVVAGEVVYRDDHHLSNGFARLRAPQLADMVLAALSR